MSTENKVFLCHNTNEKPEINKIRAFLEKREIRTFMDQYDFESFNLWKKQLEAEIRNFGTAAIFLGKSGLGPWQEKEIEMFIHELNRNSENRRLGIVILPGCSSKLLDEVTERWSELGEWQWANFGQDDPDPIERLISGITPYKDNPDLSREKKLITQKENRELRAEVFKIVADSFQREAKKLFEIIDREETRINEIDKEMTKIISNLEDIDPRLKVVEQTLRKFSTAFAKKASEFALSNESNFQVKEKSTEFCKDINWLQTEIENYIDRISLSIVTSDLQVLYDTMQHRSGFSAEVYIKALKHFKEKLIMDFEIESEIVEMIGKRVDILIKVVEYQ